jgi:hypothetical protein
MLSKVNLSPTLSLPQLTDSTAKPDADVDCHKAIVGVLFVAYLAHPLFGDRKKADGCNTRKSAKREGWCQFSLRISNTPTLSRRQSGRVVCKAQ